MDNASVHSDEDTLAPMRELVPRRTQQQQQQQQMTRRGTLMMPGGNLAAAGGGGGSRKSISLGARGAAMLSYALAAGGARRRSRGDPAAVTRLENTYRMQPTGDERFSRARVHPLVLEAMEEQLTGFDYPGGGGGGSGPAARKACELAQAIRDRVREAGFERYKLVVSACLLQRTADCAAAVASRAVWAVDCGDSFVECRYQSRTLTAVATVHALYFE